MTLNNLNKHCINCFQMSNMQQKQMINIIPKVNLEMKLLNHTSLIYFEQEHKRNLESF